MTKEQAVKLAEELIPHIYKQPTKEEQEDIKKISSNMLKNPVEYEKMQEWYKTQPTFAEVFADVFLKDFIDEEEI